MNTPAAFCAKCGTPTAADAVFCMKCGLNLTVEHAAFLPPVEDGESETLGQLRTALAGQYRVERELGRGGMATVFLAHDIKHERDVAIKVLHPDLAASLGGERFLREIRLAAKLQHPHILGLYDSGTSGSLMYYMMPFVKGESLRDRLDREGMLPLEDALRITIEVAGALGHAHEQGIVHRDIKPENILLSGGHALVADFGIASAVTEAGAQKLTQTGMAVGTPVYMAPEQSSGDKTGPTADLYSLGCTLYEMLSGEPPFTGANAMAIMARHLMEQVPSIRIVRSAVPEEVENAIFYALQKMPVDRPQNAAQFIEALTASMGQTAMMRTMRVTSAIRRPGTPMDGTAWVDAAPVVPWFRRPAIVVAAAAVVAMAAGGIWAAQSRSGAAAPNAALGENARRIAVLYFDDLSRDSSLTAVTDGLTEGLIDALATSPSLTLISRAGVEAFRGASVAVDSIARALRVGYLVRGAVEPDGGQVRVTVRLDDASGVNLRRGGFSVSADSLLQLQDSLTTLASGLIREQLGEDLRVREQRAATRSEAAWLLTQRGAAAVRQGTQRRQAGQPNEADAAYATADSLFALAEAADASWAEPITQRAALAYLRSRQVGTDPAAIRPWVVRGVDHADRALAVSPQDSDALEIRGTLRYWSWLANLDTDQAAKAALLAAAKADLERSTSINRLQASAFATLSHLYNNDPGSTNNDVSIAAQRALEADEFLSNANIVLGRLFTASYDLGQFDRADQYCQALRQRFPSDPRVLRCQLYLLTRPGTDASAIATAWQLADASTAQAAEPDRAAERRYSDMLVAAVVAQASKQQPALADSARAIIRRSEGDALIDPTQETALFGAFGHVILGDTTDAVRLLKAYLAANPSAAQALRVDPGWWFRPIAETVEFRAAVASGR